MTVDTTKANSVFQPNGVAVLKDDQGDEGPLKVRGIALTEGDKTYGASKQNLIWPPEVVKEAAEGLVGAKIVDDREHKVKEYDSIDEIPTEPPIDTIVGEVTDSRYEPGVGVLYEGEIDDPKVKDLVRNGRVEVSPFIFHHRGEYDEEKGGYPVKNVAKWRDLSVVANGAGSDASIEAHEGDSTPETGPQTAHNPENPRFYPSEGANTGATAMSAAVLTAVLDASFDDNEDENGGEDPDQRPEPSSEDGELPESGGRAADSGAAGAGESGNDAGSTGNDGVAAEALASFNHLSYSGTKSGKLDESKIDEDDFKSKYLFPGDTKSDSSFPVVDANGNLRRGNVESAWKLRGDAPVSKEEIEKVLITLAKKFDDPPQTREDASALSQAQQSDEPAEADSGTGSSSSDSDPGDGTTDMTMEITDEKEQKVVNRYRALDDPVVVESSVEALAQRADELDLESYEEPYVVEAEGLSEPHVVEKEDHEALSNRVEQVENVLAEALANRTGMKEKTAAALSIEALFNEFENEDGEFDAEALVQEPETGSVEKDPGANANGGGDGVEGVAALSDEELAEKNRIADGVMSVADWRQVEAEGLSSAEYVEDLHGVDMSTVESEQQLRRKIAAKEGGD